MTLPSTPPPSHPPQSPPPLTPYTIFMNSKNRKISDLHRLLLDLLDKINLKRSDRYVAL